MRTGGRKGWIAAVGIALWTLSCRMICPPLPSPTTPVPTLAPLTEKSLLVKTPSKYVIAVLGEGYASSDQAKFKSDVFDIFDNGVNTFPPFDDLSRIEIRRIPLVSHDSAVSTGAVGHNTALGIIFNGQASACYFTVSASALKNISTEAHKNGPVDYTVVIVNGTGSAAVGCALKEKIAIVARNASAQVLEHEFGHVIGDLYDEYPATDPDTSVVSSGNCTTETLGTNAPWHDLIAGTVTAPSPVQSGPDIGLYEGCDHRLTAIYRPTVSCTMQMNSGSFCRVCNRILDQVLDTPRPSPSAALGSAAFVHMRFLVQSLLPPDGVAKPELIDRWESDEGPPTGTIPVHALWTLVLGNEVFGAAGVTGDVSNWRAYSDAALPVQREQYVPAPFQVVDIAIPRSRINAHPHDIPELRLFSFDDRVLRSNAIDVVPPEFGAPKVIGRSPELSAAVQSLFQ